MEKNWAERLGEQRSALSRGEMALIEFITAHPHEAISLKQTELCERAGVSKPVVIACFRRLGYSDYRSFVQGIQGFYLGQIDSAQASAVALREIRSISELITASLEVEAGTIETLRVQLDPGQVEELARLIGEAGAVYLYAEGTGFEPAHYLCQRLRRCGVRALMAGTDRMHALDDLAPMSPGDLCITFFYTQNVAVVLELFRLVRERGGRTAVIAGIPDAELYPLADSHIVVPRGYWNFKNSLAGPMIFAQILLLAVEFLGGQKTQSRLQSLEALRKDFDFRTKEDLS